MQRNKFSLSHYKLLTCDMGKLIPLTWFDILPGDSIQQATSTLMRVSPMLSPVMHPCRVRIHHFFVPNRIIFDEWEDFITGGEDGTSTPTHPYRNLVNHNEGTVFDYLGVPPGTYAGLEVNALPLRAYQMIWNNFYRDQDLCTEATIDLTDGSDSSDTTLQNVCWEKDYFTTARPWETKGTQPTIPLGDTADVNSTGSGTPLFTVPGGIGESGLWSAASGSSADWDASSSGAGIASWSDPKLVADLTSATGVAINDLRLALAIQRYQEARARYGSRYVEYLKYCGVRNPSDARLMLPEYLGGGMNTISFSEVLSTDGANTGEMYGHGISAMRTNKYRRYFEEHGICMTLLSVVPKAIYANGLPRKFLREVKEDYFQRELQHIGEQEVYNKEIYTEHTTPDGVFGYQARYNEMRYQPSQIAGEFHSTNDHWHMARMFSSDPSLNSTFVLANPTKRMLASSGTDALYVMANHSIQARRAISMHSTPKTF